MSNHSPVNRHYIFPTTPKGARARAMHQYMVKESKVSEVADKCDVDTAVSADAPVVEYAATVTQTEDAPVLVVVYRQVSEAQRAMDLYLEAVAAQEFDPNLMIDKPSPLVNQLYRELLTMPNKEMNPEND